MPVSTYEPSLNTTNKLTRLSCFNGSGTQAWVHPHCLRTWQRTRDTDTRRNICPVCRTVYSSEFCNSPTMSPTRDGNLGNPMPFEDAEISYMSSMWLILPVFVFVIYQLFPDPGSFPWALAILSPTLFFVRYFFDFIISLIGVRLCFVVDDNGAPLLRLVRVGFQVQGLAAGALLVSTDRIGGGIFQSSVVVITQHDHNGSIGCNRRRARDPNTQTQDSSH